MMSYLDRNLLALAAKTFCRALMQVYRHGLNEPTRGAASLSAELAQYTPAPPLVR
jgi:hypothetical protein